MAYEGGDCRECHQPQRNACRCSSQAAIDSLKRERDEALRLLRLVVSPGMMDCNDSTADLWEEILGLTDGGGS
jgi:hypothetical protein